jgi:hypothetical protein
VSGSFSNPEREELLVVMPGAIARLITDTIAGEIKKIDQDREAELAAAEGPIDEDRPRVIRFAGVQVMGEP